MTSRSGARFAALVGFPRSGTTLLTALLDAHTDVCMYYEPWNSSPKKRPEPPATLAEFRDAMERKFGFAAGAAPVVGFKETVTYAESRDFAVRTIDNIAHDTSTHVLWIFRDPIHCFFSKLEGARKWWGRPEAEFSRSSLEQYLRESGPHLAALIDVTERHGGTIVSYEALVSRPEETLRRVMDALGVPFEPAQLDYYQAEPRPGVVMGDPDVAERPRPVSPASSVRRRKEVQEQAAMIEDVMAASEFRWFKSQCERLAAIPAVAHAAPTG